MGKNSLLRTARRVAIRRCPDDSRALAGGARERALSYDGATPQQ